MKETKSSMHKTLKNVWRKVKHGQRKDEKERHKEDIIVLCRNDALSEEDTDDYNIKRTTEISDISDSRWDEIEFISSTEQKERKDVPKKKKKFRKQVR